MAEKIGVCPCGKKFTYKRRDKKWCSVGCRVKACMLRKSRKEKGQSLVEFAISLLFLLFLLAGAAEFGVLFFQYVQLRDAAKEGSQFASACQPQCTIAEIDARVRGTSDSPINLSDPNLVFVSVSVPDKDAELMCEGDSVTVQVFYSHKIFMPFLPQILGRSDIPLNGVSIDTVLTPVCP